MSILGIFASTKVFSKVSRATCAIAYMYIRLHIHIQRVNTPFKHKNDPKWLGVCAVHFAKPHIIHRTTRLVFDFGYDFLEISSSPHSSLTIHPFLPFAAFSNIVRGIWTRGILQFMICARNVLKSNFFFTRILTFASKCSVKILARNHTGTFEKRREPLVHHIEHFEFWRPTSHTLKLCRMVSVYMEHLF